MTCTVQKSNEELDEEFIKTLRLMKPYIACIMNNHYIELIRVWLEKLSDGKLNNKILRNQYLVELGRQIEIGIFEEPFTEPPIYGDLPPLFRQEEDNVEKDKAESLRTYSKNVDYVGRNAGYELWEYRNGECLTRSDSNETKEYCYRLDCQENLRNNHQQHKVKHLPYMEMNDTEIVSSIENGLTNGDEVCNFKNQCSLMKHRLDSQIAKYGDQQSFNNYMAAYRPTSVTEKYKSPTPAALNDYSVKTFDGYKVTTPKNLSPRQFILATDSSWYDITDGSTRSVTEYGSGDRSMQKPLYEIPEVSQEHAKIKFYEQKINNLQEEVGHLKHENNQLKENMNKCKRDLNLRNTAAETSIHNLTGEVQALKKRLQELTDIKLALQNSHFAVTAEWQASIKTLQKRLQDSHKKNVELKSVIIILEKKLNDLVKAKDSKTNTLKKKLSTAHAKEIDSLKEQHKRTLKQIEDKYMEELDLKDKECNKKIEEIKKNYENELAEINATYLKDMSFKDSEVERMETLMKEQCMRVENEVQTLKDKITKECLNCSGNKSPKMYEQKIEFLQKCVVKLEKLFHKSEKEYKKQISKLKYELEIRERTCQIAMTKQKAELITTTCDIRQQDFDQIVNKLESQYQDLLHKQKQQASAEKKLDTDTINKLKEEILSLQMSKPSVQ